MNLLFYLPDRIFSTYATWNDGWLNINKSKGLNVSLYHIIELF